MLAVIIACVYKTGTFKNRHIDIKYSATNVQWLQAMLKRYTTIPYDFICLTDLDKIEGVNTIKLKHNFPGWWSKIELFRPDILNNQKVFYIDLDTVIVRNIDHILEYPHKLTVLQNLSSTDQKRIGSGLMAWNQDLSHIYEKFCKNTDSYIQEYTTSARWGDQGFIQECVENPDKFQDLFPQQIVSYKTNLNQTDPRPENRIVVFHGKPKPQEVDKEWIFKL